jgi:hypothetical protein
MLPVDPCAPRWETSWLIQPLVEAGLDLDEIGVLVTRLGFEAVVGADRSVDVRVLALVGDRPPPVRAAWMETIVRMIALEPAGG